VVVARTAATGLLQVSGPLGTTRPAHATAIGKMLLAAVPAGELDRLVETLPLPRFTANTITERPALFAEIERVRRLGVACDDCELDADVRCVAVAVRDFADRCAGAMGLSGPAWRLTPAGMEAALGRVCRSIARRGSASGPTKHARCCRSTLEPGRPGRTDTHVDAAMRRLGGSRRGSVFRRPFAGPQSGRGGVPGPSRYLRPFGGLRENWAS
jgi:hypothetical protein